MSLGEGIPQGVCNKPNLHTVVTVIVRRPIALERDGVWGTLVAAAEHAKPTWVGTGGAERAPSGL